jgi:hypothetical protein
MFGQIHPRSNIYVHGMVMSLQYREPGTIGSLEHARIGGASHSGVARQEQAALVHAQEALTDMFREHHAGTTFLIHTAARLEAALAL